MFIIKYYNNLFLFILNISNLILSISNSENNNNKYNINYYKYV